MLHARDASSAQADDLVTTAPTTARCGSAVCAGQRFLGMPKSLRWALRLALASAVMIRPAVSAPSAAASEGALAGALDRALVLRAVLQQSPVIRAAHQRARAMRFAGAAEGSLPPPELMGQVWQVPFANPGRLDSQMIMLGAQQNFPAPGSLAARQQSMDAQAQQEEAMGSDRARVVLREAGHAFSDYQEAAARHRVHGAHLEIAQRLVALAQARHAAGGALTDVTRTEVELSRLQAEVVTDATLVESARAHLNALLGRSANAQLGPPVEPEPGIAAWEVTALLAKAHAERPEIQGVLAQRAAREAAAKAADREATWPSFSLGLLYFPPTTAMPQHGYGVNASMSLPWLSGGASNRRESERELAGAAAADAQAARYAVDAEVVTAESKSRSSANRLLVLRERTLPATRRSFEAAQAGYESGRTDLMTVLDARRAVVDVEHEIVMTRSDLEHAMTDLEAAVGAEVPRRALPALDPKTLPGGQDAQ